MALKIISFIFVVSFAFGITNPNKVMEIPFNVNDMIEDVTHYPRAEPRISHYIFKNSDQNEFLIDSNIIYDTALYAQRFSSIAFDGTNYLVVWQDSRNTYDLDIYGVRVNQTGVILDSAGISISTNLYNQSYPSIAFDGNNFLVVWTDDRNINTLDIYGARVNQSGIVIDTAGIPISTYFDDQFDPAIAFDGSNYLVVWTDYRGPSYDIYGSRVTPSGIVLDSSGFLITLSHENQDSPSITYGDTNYLVVWRDERSEYDDVYGARINPEGILLDSGGIFISSYGDYEEYPSIAFDATNFLVVWSDYRNNNGDIYGARVDQNGVLLDPSGIRISSIEYHQDYPTILFDGISYLVCWEDSRGIFGTRVTQAGAVLDTAGILISSSGRDEYPSISFDGTNYLVVWSNRNDIFGARLYQTGILIDTNSLVLSTGTYWQFSPSIAFDGINYFVVWEDSRNFYESNIYGARLTQTGSILDPTGLTISTTANGQSVPALAFDGINYLVVWQEVQYGYEVDDIYGARVTPAGSLLDSIGLQISTARWKQTSPSIVFDSINYFVVWEDMRNYIYPDIYGARIDPAGLILDPEGIPISNTTNNQLSPSVAFDGTNYLVVWQEWHSGSWDDIYGARVTRDGIVLDTVGIIISNASRGQENPSVAFDGMNYLVVWQDYRNSSISTDIYGTRINPAGTVLNPNGIVISNAISDQKNPSIIFDSVNYLVIWEDRRNNDWDIYGASINTSGVVIDTFMLTIQNGYQLSPVLAKGTGNQVLINYSGWTGIVQGRSYNTYRTWGKFYPDMVGIDEENSKVKMQKAKLFEVYPNPARSFLAIRLPQTADRQMLKIFDVAGKMVKEIEILRYAQNDRNEGITRNDRDIKIPLKGINPGIYFLQLGKEVKKFLVVK
jgi:hypothetical protein